MWSRGKWNSSFNWRYTFYSNLRESPIIDANDSIEVKNEKLREINEKFLKLEARKDENALELAYMLDLFDGKLTLTELLNLEIPLLDRLKKS